MKDAKVQTQLSFKKHTGSNDDFRRKEQQQHGDNATAGCHKCLRSVFGLKEFRGSQLAIIKAVLEGRDALVVMPTGGGKSLCYQLPAVLSKGITIVVSPLLALIHDQATTLSRLGVKVGALNSSIGKKERDTIMRDLRLAAPTLKILYVTPELLATPEFRKHVAALHGREMIARLVIDEAHCISEWGHDFRKDYSKLDYFRAAFPALPILALTATATERVREDIKKTLGLPDPPKLCLFISSFNRENLYYEVRFDSNDGRYENFLGFLKGVYKSRRKRLQAELQGSTSMPSFSTPSVAISKTVELPTTAKALGSVSSTSMTQPAPSQNVEPVCGIIYCGQRLMCEELAGRLLNDGIAAAAFHSGMTPKQRANVQSRWRSDVSTSTELTTKQDEAPIDVIVATIAFGMGIDKPNVRFVCHWEMPKTIEGYYQESGRAGRDGELSRCILYYSREDRSKIEFLLEAEKERRRLQKIAKSSGVSASRSAPVMDPIQTFQKMVAYCENAIQCRHVFLCEYFGEKDVNKQDVCIDGARCDICRTPEKVANEKAEKLSNLHGFGRQAQLMGGSKAFVGSDGTVQIQGQWQSSSVALGRYDAELMSHGDDNDDDSDSRGDSSDEKSAEEEDSGAEERDEDYDSEAERKAKRRKILFGNAVDASYYKKPSPAKISLPRDVHVVAPNKHNLTHAESTKVPLNFRELCYETVEKSLSSLFQGSHKSLARQYLLRLSDERTPPLTAIEQDARLIAFVKKLAVEIERVGFEASSTQNTYRSILGFRVRDIKGFESEARAANSVALVESPARPRNQVWAMAVSEWRALLDPTEGGQEEEQGDQ